MKKHIKNSLLITMIVAIVATVAVSVSTATRGTCGDDLTWTLDDNGTLTISGAGEMEDYILYDILSPWHSLTKSIKNVVIEPGVTSIGTSAFEECCNLTSITISNSVTRIGDSAFCYCESLTSITIPDSVINIGDDAFYGCYNLTEINVDSNNPNYSSKDGVLFNKDKTELIRYPGGKGGAYEVPDGVINIGDYAFSLCDNLTTVTIPDGVTRIENYAFFCCYDLTSIIIPESARSIGDGAFQSCSNLEQITIPNGVTIIGSVAFNACESLTSITIPDSVTSIGRSAFSSCTKLMNVTIGNGVTSIGDEAFGLGKSLTEINVDSNNQNYSSEDGVLFNKDKTELLQYPGGKVGAYEIPDGVINIGDSAFYDCDSLTSITIPDSVTSIENSAFCWCESLMSVTIGNGVTRIGDSAFYYCENLTSITIPDSVINIGDDAFGSCYSLTEINVDSNNQNYSSEDGVLFNKDKTELIRYPGGKGGAYEVPDGVINIGDDAFYYCESLTSITIPDSVINIGDDTFGWCRSLTEINVDSNNQNYSSEDGALFNKDKTELLQCPGGKVGAYEIPDGVINIGDYAFYYCDSLTSITIPDGVTTISGRALSGCKNLTDVYYGGTEAQWNAIYAGSGNSLLTSANIHFYPRQIPHKFNYD